MRRRAENMGLMRSVSDHLLALHGIVHDWHISQMCRLSLTALITAMRKTLTLLPHFLEV